MIGGGFERAHPPRIERTEFCGHVLVCNEHESEPDGRVGCNGCWSGRVRSKRNK